MWRILDQQCGRRENVSAAVHSDLVGRRPAQTPASDAR